MDTREEFVYVLRPTRIEMLTNGATTAEEATVAAHFQYLQELTARGTAVLVGRTTNADTDTFEIVVLRAESPEDAETIMRDDPAVRAGVMSARLFPFRIALMGR
ncbi:MAG: hypothetical protein HC822_07700 [Oscillochloris sp.]|nr:hypothetical protein [Oscillochloris sp.]